MAEVIKYDDAPSDEPPVATDVEDDGLGGLSSRKEVRKRTRKVRQADAEFDSDLIAVLQSAEGRRLVARFLVEGRVNVSPYNPDPIEMARICGQQEFPRTLLNRLLKPELLDSYKLMLSENAGMRGEG